MLTVYFSIFILNPFTLDRDSSVAFRFLNFLVMLGAVIAIIISEERDLRERNPDYQSYMKEVPSFFGGSKATLRVSFWAGAFIPALFLIMSDIGAFLFVVTGPLYKSEPEHGHYHFFKLAKPENMRGAFYGIIEWDLSHQSRSLDVEREKTGTYPEQIPDELLQNWKNRNRAIKYSPFPQTLFYCGQVFYSVDDPDKPVKVGQTEIFAVKRLPFDLKCDKDTLEMAQAMDYDGDGYPLVFLVHLSASDNSHFWDKTFLAADDRLNILTPRMKDLLKSR